ncbi:MAG: DNA integrity scanning protein DisA nucleotide-binding domain protein, partial [Oscillospiraceae bacterium]
LCNAIFTLSDNKTGALIVIEQKTKLGEQIDTGVTLNAAISEELIGNIFFVNTPLHDGAVIIRDGRILAAACFLPKPQKEEHIASHLGSRHRAAIGISEISDAITIVVSEETGTVSITQEGELKRNFNKQSLKKFLTDNLIHKTNSEETLKLPSFWKKKSKKD